jgi:hypothetical protein
MQRLLLTAVMVASFLSSGTGAIAGGPVVNQARDGTGAIAVSGTTSTLDLGTTTCGLLGPYLVSCRTTGFVTGFLGTLVGSSSTGNDVLIDCKTGRYHGEGTETFAGSVVGLGSGTLTWRLQLSGTVTADCSTIQSFEGSGVVGHGTGDLAGLNGTLSFKGSTYSGSVH